MCYSWLKDGQSRANTAMTASIFFVRLRLKRDGSAVISAGSPAGYLDFSATPINVGGLAFKVGMAE
jgi:hypothetical protein